MPSSPAGMDLVANSPSWPIAGTVKLRKDELCALSRTELQALAKEHGIKANQKTDVLIREVMAKLEAAAAEGRSLPQAELGTTLMFGEMETETATLNADVPAEDVETAAGRRSAWKRSEGSFKALRKSLSGGSDFVKVKRSLVSWSVM